ncbi:EAL domain-containing protein [Halomonas sp. H10-9-1]|uniref:putative bifunctional diguanylate cyclase/phosphodiesterase n=1 Tax=Halomonas sp. H10-9-1 TaxID=2950871 RepID=UPI0032DF3C2D
MMTDQRDTLLQAGLYILLLASLMLGGVELLLLSPWSRTSTLPQLMSAGFAASIILISLGLLAVACGRPAVQRALSLVLALYALALGLLVATGEPSWWIDSSRVALGIIPLLLSLAWAVWCPPDTPARRRIWGLVALGCLVLGAAAFLRSLTGWYVTPGELQGNGWLMHIALVVLGVGMITLLQIRTRPRLRLPESAIVVGIIAVAFSLLGWLGAGWLVAYAAGRPEEWQQWLVVYHSSGILPALLGLSGLWFSYHLVVNRALLIGRVTQARRLELSEQRFRSLFSQSPDAVFALDPKGRLTDANPTAVALMRLDKPAWQGQYVGDLPMLEAAEPCEREALTAAFRRTLEGQATEQVLRLASPRGRRVFSVTLMPILVRGGVEGAFSVVKDLTERVHTAERLRLLERSIEASHNAVMIVDARHPNYAITYVNPAFTRMTGFVESEILGSSPEVLRGRGTRDIDVTRICQALDGGEPLGLTLRTHRRDGQPFWNQLYLSPVTDEGGTLTHFVGIMSDVTEHKEQQNQLAYQATHDTLTGLLNRATLNKRLSRALNQPRNATTQLAVMFIDLDEFKPINDTLGHQVGDEMLVQVATRLNQELRGGDLLARIGGDEFILLPSPLESVRHVEALAERLLRVLRRPFSVHGQLLHVTASIGISLAQDPASDPERLIQQADMAMYKAKQWGRNTYQFFSDDLDTALVQRVTLRNELQRAMEHDQLEVHYQPQVDAQGQAVGVEALVRWQHPERGLVPPADFIPLAEQTGQIVMLGNLVLEQACRDAAAWHRQGCLPGRISVNLSPTQFHRGGFLEHLQTLLAATQLPGSCLEMEITENSLLQDTESAIGVLQALTELGIATAIDDFGTGFSSLSYLSRLPIDKIKIDRTFIEALADSPRDAAICRAIVHLASEMSLRLVAEGIETADQFQALEAMGCPAYQGYYFARPMTAPAMQAFLKRRTLTAS